jgi:hypothetical protein
MCAKHLSFDPLILLLPLAQVEHMTPQQSTSTALKLEAELLLV